MPAHADADTAAHASWSSPSARRSAMGAPTATMPSRQQAARRTAPNGVSPLGKGPRGIQHTSLLVLTWYLPNSQLSSRFGFPALLAPKRNSRTKHTKSQRGNGTHEHLKQNHKAILKVLQSTYLCDSRIISESHKIGFRLTLWYTTVALRILF